jgi:hypothetical protein
MKRPDCPICGKAMSKTVLGMTDGPLPEGYISIGCIAYGDNPDWLCADCTKNGGWGFDPDV